MNDIHYSAVHNKADYKNGLKDLYNQYSTLTIQAETGNGSALAIKADLDRALDILDEKQQTAIRLFFILNKDYITVQQELKFDSPEQLKNYLSHAIRKASKFLN